MEQYRIIHYLNQFFSGRGGEEQAGLTPELLAAPRGPGVLIEKTFPLVRVVATVTCGDNYLAENSEAACGEIIKLLAPFFEKPARERPQLLLAGPAFNAGRYGLGCGAVCAAVAEHFAIPVVTAMYPENPAVAEYRQKILIAEAGPDVMGMAGALGNMVGLGIKLLRQEEVAPASDHYLAQGRRLNFFAAQSGARRAVDLLLGKIKGEPFVTEYRMPVFDRVAPAPPVADLARARLALVTSGGIVPKGNPDRIESANAHCFGTYPLKGLAAFTLQTHQTAHGGYDPTFANQDPNRVLPLDAVRDLEAQGAFGSLHHYYYATVGNATPVASARRFGQEIAKNLVADGVQAVILTST